VDPATCPIYTGAAELVRVCMFDSNGKTYPLGGELHALPQAPPYGAMFVFEPDSIPAAEDVTTAGAAAGIRAYAGPYSAPHSIVETSETNRIPAGATLAAGGAVTVWVSDPVPAGHQIAIILDYAALYRSRISPSDGKTCTWPSAALCTHAGAVGFTTRFYVGAVPSSLLPKAPVDAADPESPCLLATNAALTGEVCCYRRGHANTCGAGVACGDADGPDCCKVHGTENTAYGRRCCVYADGRSVDGAVECAQLLASGQ
jgi:hypothetical protein